MALQSSGPISNGNVQGEFGGSNPASLSEYYSAATGVPSTGNPISLSDFYGTSNVVTFSYEMIGGGGAGGYGRSDGGGSGSAADGAASTISASGMTTITASGGSGGTNAVSLWNDTSNRDGQASHYGAGGSGGASNSASPGTAPNASHFGAGGGGGGSDAGSKGDNDGAGGIGGSASTRITGTVTVPAGTTLTITVGGGAVGYNHLYADIQGRGGGNGANGVVYITYNGVTTTHNASTQYTPGGYWATGAGTNSTETIPISQTHTQTLN